jgi:hypothetical protein
VLLSSQVLPITKAEALVLLAEARLDSFVKEFKGLVRELLCGCQLRDFQATPEEMSRWFGEGPSRPQEEEDGPENECPRGNGGTPSYSTMCKEVDEKMAFRPTRHLMEGELDNTRLGRVTGWIQFAGMKGTVVLNLRGNFHRDIQGAKIRITGNARWESSEAIARMRGFSRFQNGKVGNITAGLPPADFGVYPFVEWYSEENGRVVIEPDRNHIEVIGQPVPLEQAIPVSAREQAENMAEFLETIARSIERHG